MHADHAVDDEFEPRQADALVRNAGEVECAVGIADVHHDLGLDGRERIQLDDLLFEGQGACIDKPGVTFRTGHGDFLAFLDGLGGVAAADYRRNAEFARNDGGVTSASAAIGDDGGSALHHRFPIRIGHVGDQHVTALHAGHFLHVANDAGRPGADALADPAAARQHLGFFLQRVALHAAADAALHGFRSRLQDVDLAGVAVLAPLDVHRAAVVLFDGQRLLRQFDDVFVGDAKTHCGPRWRRRRS